MDKGNDEKRADLVAAMRSFADGEGVDHPTLTRFMKSLAETLGKAEMAAQAERACLRPVVGQADLVPGLGHAQDELCDWPETFLARGQKSSLATLDQRKVLIVPGELRD